MLGFLLKPRWLGLLAFVLVFGAVCFQMGSWQFERHVKRLDRNEVIREAFRADPVPLDVAVGVGEQVKPASEWISVTATGTYDPAASATVKFLSRDGVPGADVVVPLRLADGTAMLVDRGWVQTDNSGRKPQIPDPPRGKVSIVGWLRPNNGAGGEAVRINGGQVRAIDSVGYGESVSYRLRSGYLNLRSEKPSVADSPTKEPKPDLSQGVHFFYGVQWWFFAMIGLVGYSWFALGEARTLRAAARASVGQPPSRTVQASETKSK